jgi:hypothetical protein
MYVRAKSQKAAMEDPEAIPSAAFVRKKFWSSNYLMCAHKFQHFINVTSNFYSTPFFH